MTIHDQNSPEYINWCAKHNVSFKFKKQYTGKNFKKLYENRILKEFKQYLRNTDAIKYTSVTEGPDGDFSIRQMDYVHRWSTSYKAKYQARLEQLNDWFLLQPQPITFMTLTSYQSDGLLIQDQITNLKNGWNHLAKVIRKDYPGLDYLWAFDFHKSGYAHYHIILFKSIKPIDIIRYADLWQNVYKIGDTEHGIDLRVHDNKNMVNNIVGYMFSHTKKLFYNSRQSPGFWKFHSSLWSMGRPDSPEMQKLLQKQNIDFEPGKPRYPGTRSYGMSKHISHLMKLPDKETTCVKCVQHKPDGNDTVHSDGVRETKEEVQAWHEYNNQKKFNKALDEFLTLSL